MRAPDKPFLDVWFENDTTGHTAGACGVLPHHCVQSARLTEP